MSVTEKRNKTILFFIGISIFGLFTSSMSAIYPTRAQENFLWRKPLVGSIFAIICTCGVVAALFPQKCSLPFGLINVDEGISVHAPKSTTIRIRGHHPDCGRFSGHVLRVGRFTVCAACTGLFLGAIAAILGTVLYCFIEVALYDMGVFAIALGQVCIIAGFLQLKSRDGFRLLLNALFVIGAFLTLIGTDVLAENTILDLYVISLTLCWILTRIMLSEWDHNRTCHFCGRSCRVRTV